MAMPAIAELRHALTTLIGHLATTLPSPPAVPFFYASDTPQVAYLPMQAIPELRDSVNNLTRIIQAQLSTTRLVRLLSLGIFSPEMTSNCSVVQVTIRDRYEFAGRHVDEVAFNVDSAGFHTSIPVVRDDSDPLHLFLCALEAAFDLTPHVSLCYIYVPQI